MLLKPRIQSNARRKNTLSHSRLVIHAPSQILTCINYSHSILEYRRKKTWFRFPHFTFNTRISFINAPHTICPQFFRQPLEENWKTQSRLRLPRDGHLRLTPLKKSGISSPRPPAAEKASNAGSQIPSPPSPTQIPGVRVTRPNVDGSKKITANREAAEEARRFGVGASTGPYRV